MEAAVKLYNALVDNPLGATSAIFATAWFYERVRNAKLQSALMDTAADWNKTLGNFEITLAALKDILARRV